MASTRGQANQSLYLARILLRGWRGEVAAESVPVPMLTRAYLPAVRRHLADAYGWFLLEITRPGAVPEAPPHGTSELPGIAQGKAVPGEIREFQRLEREGWIGAMLSEDSFIDAARSSGNLAVSTGGGPDEAQAWADALQGLFDRMADSLDEY